MKIVDNRKRNTVAFANVAVARTFTFLHTDEMGNRPYMRINDVITEDGCILNAVNLEEGYLVNVTYSEAVVLCDAEVVVH